MKIVRSVIQTLCVLATAVTACQGAESSHDLGSYVTAATQTTPAPDLEHVAQVLVQTNLVSDQQDVANHVDPNLVNAWGLAFNPAGAAWVSDNGTGLSTVYDATGTLRLTVTIPPPTNGSAPSAPTGQVFNPESQAFRGDKFIFVTEDGTVSGWQPSDGENAQLRFDNSANQTVYKGVALAHAAAKPRLYAADFRNARIDIFDENYNPVQMEGAFVDQTLPEHYAPFNVFAFQDLLLVSYALQNEEKKDDVPGEGHGFVNLFDAEGHFLVRLISGGALNSPWGMAVTPPEFGSISRKLLVGNFGNGRINVYGLDPQTSELRLQFEGTIGDSPDHPLVIDGLWSLAFGPDANGFNPRQLYFTAGPAEEMHGLFGRLEIPDP